MSQQFTSKWIRQDYSPDDVGREHRLWVPAESIVDQAVIVVTEAMNADAVVRLGNWVSAGAGVGVYSSRPMQWFAQQSAVDVALDSGFRTGRVSVLLHVVPLSS